MVLSTYVRYALSMFNGSGLSGVLDTSMEPNWITMELQWELDVLVTKLDRF